jgi:4-hydroxy-tetrahydrodipicolinate reductase
LSNNPRPVRVGVAGAAGKMGRAAIEAIQSDPRLTLAGLLYREEPVTALVVDVPAFTHPLDMLTDANLDVFLDLTNADSVVANVDLAIAHRVSPVVGATGYSSDDIQRWDILCRENGVGGIACPNFSVGALLMMRFASEAARFFTHAEVIELHHDGKRDAPSGTALRTVEAMVAAGAKTSSGSGQAPPSRGLMSAGVPIHSVRLPGLVAHQEVLFGGLGEILTIRHDSLSRDSFMPGLLEACATVPSLSGMVYGLEKILF